LLRDPEEVGVDGMVFLYPQTKTASRNVHRQLAVRVLKDPRAHWPMVVVGWKEEGKDHWELVHKDNIRKRSTAAATTKADKTEGDTVGAGSQLGTKRLRVMPSAKKYEPSEEQLPLW
jgi:hypothetical protein